MRPHLVAAVLFAVLPFAAQGAWVMVSSEPGRRVELDPSTLKKEEGGKQVVMGRVLFEKDLSDPRSSSTYRSIETVARYDCANRTITTLKRTLRKADGELLREEELKSAVEVPVRTGSVDEKLIREICRPSGGDSQTAASKTVEKANEAAGDLRKANEAMIQKEVEKELQKSGQKEAAKEAAKPVDATPAAAPKVVAKPRPVVRKPVAARPASAQHEPAMAHAHIHWAYEGDGGPDNWGKLKPEYGTCASGRRQSPIDIRDGIRVDLPPIEFGYRPSQFRIVDNGHTVQVALSGSILTVLGKTYDLVQMHFHRPSEERINGRGFDMVAHLVHKSEDGKLAVVAVLMERGIEHPFIQMLWNYMPLEKNEDVQPPNVVIDPMAIIPLDKSYYTYMGSLTTPPCTEGVLWLVMKQPIQVSPEQIAIFSRLYRNNARPVQPGFGRLIKESR